MRALAVLSLAVATEAVAAPAAPISRPAESCGTQQVRPTAAPPQPWLAAPGGQRTIYLNRFGGTYELENAASDSARNVANTRVSAGGRVRTAMITPLTADFDWPMIAACVKDHFSTYNVRIVESEPATGVYVEAVVGGSGSALGYSPTSLFGIAAADNFCGVTEAGIAFSFSEAHRNVPQHDAELCATISHEVGHLLALEHEQLGTDLMSYVLVSDTTSKSFVDAAAGCGTAPGQPSNCACSSSGQTNSAQRLTTYVGPRPIEGVPPSVAVIAPGNGNEVPPTFDVIATATDDAAMSDVIVLVDNAEVGGSADPVGDRYEIRIRNVAEGSHTMTVIARDQAGNETTEERTIVVSKLAMGETCLADDACVDGLCANTTDGAFCTRSCVLDAGDCPDGFACVAAGAMAVCVATDTGGCGCASGDPSTGGGLLLMLGVGMLVVRRRRRA